MIEELDIAENSDNDLTEDMNNENYKERWEHLEDYAVYIIEDSVKKILFEDGLKGRIRNRFNSPIAYFYRRGRKLDNFNLVWNKQYLKKSYRECRKQYKNFKKKCLEAFYLGYKEMDNKQRRLSVYKCLEAFYLGYKEMDNKQRKLGVLGDLT